VASFTLREEQAAGPRLGLVVAIVVALLVAAVTADPVDLWTIYFVEQDVPVLCAMIGAALLFSYLRVGARWRNELHLTPAMALAGAGLIILIGVVGRSLVMLDYDFSRDEQLASLAAKQIASGSLVTAVPHDWQPFGHAMLPNLTFKKLPADLVWVSGYLPLNSALRVLVGTVVDPTFTNPLLLVIGLFALWKVARRLWPDRTDAAAVSVLLAATSSQLLATSMTSYAMTAHFALNMLWLALFLRDDKRGVSGALLVAFLTMGLHKIHFHLLFAAPFLFWLTTRRQWRTLAVYGLGYAASGLLWWKLYPELVVHLSGVAAHTPRILDFWVYLAKKFGRLFAYSPVMWLHNLARFVAWQNFLLLPLALAAVPLTRNREGREAGALLPLLATCLIGLVLMVEQGPGWGYRYLHGLIGCFCLVAGYGWCRVVPQAGPSRAWAMVKYACAFSLLVLMPVQFAMARTFVTPAAKLHRAILAAPADVVLVDVSGGLFAWDIVQNGIDFAARPKMMDLSLIPASALVSLCRTRRVL
jgi:hypothetical protein